MTQSMIRGVQVSLMVLALAAQIGCGGGDKAGGGGDPDLVGVWIGNEVGDDVTIWVYTFSGAGTIEVTTSGVEAYKGTYTADPLSSPKRLTGEITDCPYAPYVGQTTNAIYKIEGTGLTFAGNEPGNSAVPTSFTPGGNTRVFLLVKQ
jgi:uncharacterized protein (TIGR03067 family)